MHGAHVDPRPQPASCGSVPETVEEPFFGVEFRACRDLLTPVVQKAVVEMAFRGREDERAVRHMRMFAQDLRDLFGVRDGAFFPIFRQKPVLGFCPDVDAPTGEVKVRPVERLEFAAAKACREHQGKERPLPVVTFAKKSLQFRVGVADGSLGNLGRRGTFLTGLSIPSLLKKLWRITRSV